MYICVKWLLYLCRSERSGSVSPPNYLADSFVQGIKAGAIGTKTTSSGSTENGQIHQLQQLTSKQERPTSKQEQPASKQDQSTTKHQSKTSKQQITKEQEENGTQEEPNRDKQLNQVISETLEVNKQQQKATKDQQKHNDHSEHGLDNSIDTGPDMSSVIEPMENDHSNTVDAWKSEQSHQEEDKSRVIKNGTDNGFDDGTSPISSESVTSPDLVHCKGSAPDDNVDDSQNGDDRLGQLANRTPLSSSSFDVSRLTARKRAISMDVLSPSDTSKTPIYFDRQQSSTPLRYRSQTVFGEPKRKTPPIPGNKSPSTHSKKSISSHSSLGDMRRPVQSSVSGASGFNSSGTTYHGKFDILGVLRVRLRGVSIPDHTTEVIEAPPPQIHQLSRRPLSCSAITLPEATHGIYCVFTINGGNTSAKSETCKVLPYRPVLWEEDEKEKLFFTNHSRQLFILCRKVPLKKKSKGSSEVCVGASVMKIIEINPTLPQQKVADFTCTKGLKWYNKTLPLQPNGEIELSVSFEGVCIYILIM